MKKIFFIGGLIAFFLIGINFVSAQSDNNPTPTGQIYGWDIISYNTTIDLKENGGFSVKENILTDFYVFKHGIFRYVPLKYKVGGIFNYFLKIDLEGIYKDDGSEWDYEETKSGKFWEYKIGSPYQTIQGRQLYKVTYNVDRGIRYFNDHDELYWNVTGTDWEAPIQNVRADIVLPKDIKEEEMQFNCFTGYYGSTSQNCNYVYDEKNKTISFASVEKDYDNNYLTIAVWFPKGYLIEPTSLAKIGHFVKDNYVLFIPILAFIIMFLIWNKKGKDPKSNKPIVAQYDACDHLTPGLVKVIEKERIFDGHDLPAEIVHLATMRILKIKEIDSKKKKYKIIRRRDWQDNKKVTSYQKYLLDQVFPKGKDGNRPTEIDLDDLKTKFNYKNAQQYKKLANIHVKEKGYYQTAVSAKGIYIGLGMLVFMFSVIWTAATESGFNFIVGIISTIIVIAFGMVMPKKSEKGIEMLNYIKGLKKYIDVAEKDRIKGEEAANIFSKVLPFAMTMGLTEKWVNVFDGILKQPPEWLEVTDTKAFTTAYLFTTLNRFETTTYKGFAPAYRSGGSSSSSGFSSGGGFSGGGFGGGGGGSW